MRRRWPFLCGGVLLAGIVGWGAGLVWFGNTMPTAAETVTADPTEAIVVLTGGRERLAEGVRLLLADKAQKLFVSGVNPAVTREALLHAQGLNLPNRERLILGYQATDTFDNAEETSQWMHTQGYTSLQLVTSNYHMRRSLLEFRRAMPTALIIPRPVDSGVVDAQTWWQHPQSVIFVAREYNKYLAVLIRSAF